MSGSVSFDPVADRYDDTRGYPAEVAERIAAGMMRVGPVPAGSNLLEIGIGTGRIALPLLAEGVNITGVDISPRMLERLHANLAQQQAAEPDHNSDHNSDHDWGTLTAKIADMTALPFTDASFDAAVGVHVLHLVPEWRTALDEVLRVVRPGGALLVGQDVHGVNSPNGVVQDEWRSIVTKLGYVPVTVGAPSFQIIVGELESRGLTVTVETLTTWEMQQTPREALQYIASRTWSRTWPTPDAIFEQSIQRLNAWADRHYKGKLDTITTSPHSFKVARAVRN
jgi:ubiquinone/menaquinone biosynthesis C-methylase UbiE